MIEYRSVVGIDPGKITGYFRYRHALSEYHRVYKERSDDVRSQLHEYVTDVSMYEIDDVTELMYWLEQDLRFDTVVAIEGFQVIGKMSDENTQKDALYIIPQIERLADERNCPFEMYYPADKKGRTDGQLRALNWWHIGGAGHANDAARHALNAALKHKVLGPELQQQLKDYLEGRINED